MGSDDIEALVAGETLGLEGRNEPQHLRHKGNGKI